MQNEFDLLKTLNNLFSKWLMILALAVLVGLVGLAISCILPPMYQAEAVFHASIDFTEINFENLVDSNDQSYEFTQYDEDLAVQVVQRVLLEKMDAAYDYALTLDPGLDSTKFERDSQIQRYHAQWHLRYRHEDPAVAQAIVNYWADEGYQALLDAQESGEAESFVIADLVSKASLPETPLYQHRNTLVLAGTIIGLLAGIILVDSMNRFKTSSQPEV